MSATITAEEVPLPFSEALRVWDRWTDEDRHRATDLAIALGALYGPLAWVKVPSGAYIRGTDTGGTLRLVMRAGYLEVRATDAEALGVTTEGKVWPSGLTVVPLSRRHVQGERERRQEETQGTCPECWTVLSASGVCGCQG